jgi:hypothetical protein
MRITKTTNDDKYNSIYLSHSDLCFGRHLNNKLLKQWFLHRLAVNNIHHLLYSDYTSNSSNGIFNNTTKCKCFISVLMSGYIVWLETLSKHRTSF